MCLPLRGFPSQYLADGKGPSKKKTLTSKPQTVKSFDKFVSEVWQPLEPDLAIVTVTGDEGRRAEQLRTEASVGFVGFWGLRVKGLRLRV